MITSKAKSKVGSGQVAVVRNLIPGNTHLNVSNPYGTLNLAASDATRDLIQAAKLYPRFFFDNVLLQWMVEFSTTVTTGSSLSKISPKKSKGKEARQATFSMRLPLIQALNLTHKSSGYLHLVRSSNTSSLFEIRNNQAAPVPYVPLGHIDFSLSATFMVPGASAQFQQKRALARQLRTKYKTYCQDVKKFTLRAITTYPKLIGNCQFANHPDYSLDHRYSQKTGFLNGFPPEVIGDVSNLEYIPRTENSRKGDKCSKSGNMLLSDYISQSGNGILDVMNDIQSYQNRIGWTKPKNDPYRPF